MYVEDFIQNLPSTTCFSKKLKKYQKGEKVEGEVKMRYNKIRKMDISNGPGVRVSIFVQGCTFNCKNCFNHDTHDFNGGKEFTDETINRVLELCDKDHIEGLSILLEIL